MISLFDWTMVELKNDYDSIDVEFVDSIDVFVSSLTLILRKELISCDRFDATEVRLEWLWVR